MTADDIIAVTYKSDLSHISDYTLGYQHQAHKNARMIFDASWGRYFVWIRTNLLLLSAFAAAVVYTVTLPWYPGVWPVVGYWVFAPAPFVALAVWFILWRGERHWTKSYSEAFARWNIEFDRMYSPHHQVEIGPQGYRQVTRIETIQLSWARYHYAIAQPNSLVLVFHGTIAVIPSDALPIPSKDIIEKIHRWAAAQQNDIKPLS